MKYIKDTPIVVIILIVIVVIVFLGNQDSNDWFSSDLFSEISYEVPSKFESDEEYTDLKYYSYYDNDVYCNLSIDAVESDLYEDFKGWFSDGIQFNLNDKVGELKEVTVNGNKMYYIDKKSKNSTVYYYGIKSSNYYYFITYTLNDYERGDREDIDSNLCYNAKDEIINTIEVK